MANILHLTDIHLGPNQDVDDIKEKGVLKPTDIRSRYDLYKNTLKSLAKEFKSESKKLDYLIISGDLTIGNNEDGYKLLEGLMEALGEQRPKPKKIIIVPGNHDVQRGLKIDDSKRYKLFKKYVIDKGYTVPYIETLKSSTSIKDSIIVDENIKTIFIAINSSHFCNVSKVFENQDEWDKLIKSKGISLELSKEIEKNRMFDICRIPPEHLTALQDELSKYDDSYFKIAITHHPYTSVTSSEEFKKFETMTNAGLFTGFLYSSKVNAVLHGHKHTQSTFWDILPDFDIGYNKESDQHKILVISGSQLPFTGNGSQEICKVLELHNKPTESNLTCHSISASKRQGSITKNETGKYYFGDFDDDKVNTIISGRTIHETYPKILELFAKNDDSENVHNLITEIKSNIKFELPESYESNDSNESEKSKVEEYVTWWQQPKRSKLETVKFTHGARLYQFGETETNQIDYIIKNLEGNQGTSKGIAILYNPDVDGKDSNSLDPHFCLVQFQIVERLGELFLDVIAFFRKQEMRHWWLINAAELMNLQQKVHHKLENSFDKKLKIGAITTYTSQGYLGKETALPGVAIPKLDRLFDLEIDRLDYLVITLFGDRTNVETWKNLWIKVLNGLIPGVDFDRNGIPISIEGLGYCIQKINWLLTHHRKVIWVKNFNAKLKELHSINVNFRREFIENKVDRAMYDTWRFSCKKIVKNLIKSITIHYK